MPKLMIDGNEYDTDQLSEEAKNQILSIKFVDRKIENLKNEIAVFQTARIAYGRALENLIRPEGKIA